MPFFARAVSFATAVLVITARRCVIRLLGLAKIAFTILFSGETTAMVDGALVSALLLVA